DRAMEKIEGKQKVEKIVILTESGILHHVIIGDILYVESFAHRQILHLEGGETITEVRRSLKRILDELEERAPKQFFIPYKGYVVNKRKIKVVEKKEIILSSDDTIPIPVRKFREIRDLFFDYVFSEEEEMKE
ncbi:MAG: LytTR family transcriptional regulator DNA-binding domain-containing protein, partial [Anaerovoracaceae bacterium]